MGLQVGPPSLCTPSCLELSGTLKHARLVRVLPGPGSFGRSVRGASAEAHDSYERVVAMWCDPPTGLDRQDSSPAGAAVSYVPLAFLTFVSFGRKPFPLRSTVAWKIGRCEMCFMATSVVAR